MCEEEKQMVRGKKKTKICDKGSQEDIISKLPDPLICEILFHLPTKDSVRTSVLSTRWRNLWHWVPGLDFNYSAFLHTTTFESFVQQFCDSHKDSWIRKLRFSVGDKPFLTPVIDAVTTRMIQHIDVASYGLDIPMSIYTCETLVHLQLREVTLPNTEFVFLPCLKIIHFICIRYPNVATLEKLVSSSPVLEDLTILNSCYDEKVIRLCSQTVKRIDIDKFTIVIDAPLLQCLKIQINKAKNFEIIHSGFLVKLEIEGPWRYDYTETYSESLFCDILTDISRVRELVISNAFWKGIFRYSKSGPVLQFRGLSCLNAKLCKSNIEMLPTILESCPKLESLILELVNKYEKKEPKLMFSAAPQCLVSSLKIVQYKRLISRYEGEMELVRYFLKNSRILEKFKLDIYDTEKAKCAVLQELVAIPRCSSGVEVNVSFGKKDRYG